MGLKAEPDFSLTIGGADATDRIRDRLLSLTVTDNSGEEADEIEITLDDRDNAIETPRRGVDIDVSLGWAGEELIPIGRFTVDEVEPSGPPDQLVIRGKAADMRASFKAPKTRAWRETTIQAIVSRIASEHGLQPAVAQALGGQAIAHRDQSNESDLHFLTRLGRDYGAVAAPKNGRLVFAPAGEGTSASGQALPSVALARNELISWRGVAADRESVGKVRARYRDQAAARTRYAEAGDGEPVRTLRHLHRDQAAAQAAAQAELSRTQRAENGIELTLPGRAELAAQVPMTVSGLRPEMSGAWIASRVEHRMDFASGGFTTVVTGEKPA